MVAIKLFHCKPGSDVVQERQGEGYAPGEEEGGGGGGLWGHWPS